ncbi:uncharacterized protein LOC143282423 [Babylonia areolata]|uniref:uncharacterized protein LOC143282423 n=1 Tax=Babylonia areolata TaxID=304850 RepID=UPI003FD6BEAC
MATTGGNDKLKRAFDFRMSKKVAELTQVVHMLFTRNHEKEVELDALKDAYEHEISEVIDDARNRIAQLKNQVEDLQKHQEGVSDKSRKQQEEEFLLRERELKSKLQESERQLQEERTECQNLRDMLIRAQRDIENLRQGASQQMTSQADELGKRDREIERLKKQAGQLETSLKDCSKESQEVVKDLEKNNDGLERELRHVHAALEESHRTRDQLLVRNKQLEADLKTLRRDFNRKVTEVVNGQKLQRNNVDYSPDYNEELERLRREVQRYRLELSNRDVNFNRMFTEKQPVHVDRSSSNMKWNHSGFHTVNGMTNMVPMRRERTLTRLPSGPVLCFDDGPSQHTTAQRQRSSSTPSSHLETRDSRFPSICSTPDLKPRDPPTRSRLAKPKPLPKELLYGK